MLHRLLDLCLSRSDPPPSALMRISGSRTRFIWPLSVIFVTITQCHTLGTLWLCPLLLGENAVTCCPLISHTIAHRSISVSPTSPLFIQLISFNTLRLISQ